MGTFDEKQMLFFSCGLSHFAIARDPYNHFRGLLTNSIQEGTVVVVRTVRSTAIGTVNVQLLLVGDVVESVHILHAVHLRGSGTPTFHLIVDAHVRSELG